MNIIGGICKGRLISMPKGTKIRPTSNKVREALFSILGKRIMNAEVLDLFAGSGSLGLEALSRGAVRAVFIDSNARCVKTIRDNFKSIKISVDAKIIQLHVLQGIRKLSGKAKFDLVFMDPPYFKEWIKKTLINLDQYDILKDLSLVICEHHKKEVVPENIGRLRRCKQSYYGDTTLSFYKYKGELNEEKSSISRNV